MKMMVLESPAKIKSIRKYLKQMGIEKDWIVTASVGHIRDLPDRRMGIEPPDFKPEYVISKGKESVVAGLKRDAKKCTEVWLATDDDREGEAIAYHIKSVIGKHTYKRIKMLEITKKALEAGLKAPGDLDMDMVAAQETRRFLDRRVGYRVSPALSNLYGGAQGLSGGRVQSPAVRLLAEREIEIRDFVPESHLGVILSFNHEDIDWKAEWDFKPLLKTIGQEGEKLWKDKAVAQRAADVKQVKIEEVNVQEKIKRAPAPFTTSKMQQAASSVLKMRTKQCMDAAQKLFEAGLITYHRTDSPAMSQDGMNMSRAYIKSNHPDYLPEKPNFFSAGADAQGAHEAIRPSDFNTTSASNISAEADRLYQLIHKQAVQCQMKPGVDQVTAVTLRDGSADGFMYKASGTVQQFDGWRVLSKGGASKSKEPKLPTFLDPKNKGRMVNVPKGEVKNKKTEPPQRYTEAKLVAQLEKEGIGRPATYASIITNIMDSKNYISEDANRYLHCTDKGMIIFKALVNKFQFMELKYTKGVEKQLDDIATGKANWKQVLSAADKVLDNEIANLGSHSVTDAEIQQMSAARPATAKMKSTVRDMAKAKGIKVEAKDLASFGFCQKFLDEHIDSAPSEKMLEFAKSISAALSLQLTDEIKESREACKKFISDNSKAFDRAQQPSEKQLKFAEGIAEKLGVELTEKQRVSLLDCKNFIDKNKEKAFPNMVSSKSKGRSAGANRGSGSKRAPRKSNSKSP